MVDSNISKKASGFQTYVSCRRQNLGSGLLVGDILPDIVAFVDEALFQSYCDNGLPVYNTAKDGKEAYHYLEIVTKDWNKYLMRKGIYERSFSYGVYPVVLSFTANFVITISLTLLIFLNIGDRRYKYTSRLLKIGSLISSINILIFVTRALKKLKSEHEKYGITTAGSVMSLYSSDLTFSILDLISVFMIQLCQVMIVNRLFPRNLEKRICIFLGVPLVVVSNVLWAVLRLDQSMRTSPRYWGTLPPFVYLFRIALSTSYACTITSYSFIKRRFCIHSFQMGILSLLAILVVLLQPILFITDVSDAWLWGVGELFTTTCYVGSAFIVWEWLERLTTLERNEQAQSILGRPFYEDEQQEYRIARYALEVQRALGEDYDEDDEGFSRIPSFIQDSPSSLCATNSKNTITVGKERESFDQVKFNQRPAIKEILKQKLFTSYIYVMRLITQAKNWGLEMLNIKSKGKQESAKREGIVRKRIGLDKRDEVYIYSTKDIVFESDEE